MNENNIKWYHFLFIPFLIFFFLFIVSITTTDYVPEHVVEDVTIYDKYIERGNRYVETDHGTHNFYGPDVFPSIIEGQTYDFTVIKYRGHDIETIVGVNK